MHFLLEWCVAMIKRLLARDSDISYDIAFLRNQISNISSGGNGALQSGAGNPEGVIDAANGQFYIDTTLVEGFRRLYCNLSTTGMTGWIELLEF